MQAFLDFTLNYIGDHLFVVLLSLSFPWLSIVNLIILYSAWFTWLFYVGFCQ